MPLDNSDFHFRNGMHYIIIIADRQTVTNGRFLVGLDSKGHGGLGRGGGGICEVIFIFTRTMPL